MPDFLSQLGMYRSQISEVFENFIPRREPDAHLYGIIRDVLANSGKGLRPALCLATCGAYGGDIQSALNSAAAIEMVHNAFLVHDDIEDFSENRHGRPALHLSQGLPLAVNVGDALQALSMRLLRRNLDPLGPDITLQIFDEFDHMLVQSLEGQAMELGWVRDNNCDLETADYLRLVLKKTCWYSFIHPCRIGALIAQRNNNGLDRFNEFGFFLGAAFQISDDLLNLTGSSKYGKELNGDLYEGKRTLMLAHLLNSSSPADRLKLQSLLGKSRQSRLPREVWSMSQSLRDVGSLDFAHQTALSFLSAAQDSFESAFSGALENEHKQFLRALLPYVVNRDK
jgi:geranylgeranyl pyrophosphate synthase